MSPRTGRHAFPLRRSPVSVRHCLWVALTNTVARSVVDLAKKRLEIWEGGLLSPQSDRGDANEANDSRLEMESFKSRVGLASFGFCGTVVVQSLEIRRVSHSVDGDAVESRFASDDALTSSEASHKKWDRENLKLKRPDKLQRPSTQKL